jgi:hypothetical protein
VKKLVTEEGYEHKSIVLKPNSFDSSHEDIIINEENGGFHESCWRVCFSYCKHNFTSFILH